jgi:hypothetical protein
LLAPVTGNCSVVRAHDDSVWYNRNRVGRQRSCAFILHPTVLYPPFGSPAHAFLQRMTPVALAPRESDRPTRLLAVSPHSASHARTAAAFASVLPVGGSLTRIAFLCAQRGQRPFRYCDRAVRPFATDCCRLQRACGLRRVELCSWRVCSFAPAACVAGRYKSRRHWSSSQAATQD